MNIELVYFFGLYCVTLLNVTFYVHPTDTCAHEVRGFICIT